MLTPDPSETTITMTLAEYRSDMEFAAKIGGQVALLRDTTEKLRESMKENG